MGGWNTSFLSGWPIFRGYVSFRECKVWSKEPHFSKRGDRTWKSSWLQFQVVELWWNEDGSFFGKDGVSLVTWLRSSLVKKQRKLFEGNAEWTFKMFKEIVPTPARSMVSSIRPSWGTMVVIDDHPLIQTIEHHLLLMMAVNFGNCLSK